MKWFKHDSDAHTDAKLRRVRLKYGMQGYGLYWYCLELIARGVEKHRLTFELEHDAELISADTGISRELVEEMMRFMASAGLFEDRGGIITCLKMASRTDEYTAKMLANRQSVPIVSGQTPDSVGIKSALLEEKRREEKKLKETSCDVSRARKAPRFSPPTAEDVNRYCRETGHHIDAERFIDHYASNGWRVGKVPMKSWQHAVAGWWRRDQDKAIPRGGTRARSIAEDLTDRSWANA
jgi:hypothetical protein